VIPIVVPADFILSRLDSIYAFALRRCGNAADAADLAHDIVVQALENLSSIRNPDKRDAWLWSVARFTYFRRLRARENERRHYGGPYVESGLWPVCSPPPEQELDRQWQIGRIRLALATLQKECREVIVSHYLDGQTSEQIAARLGLTPGTVRWRLYEARRRLRDKEDSMEEIGIRSYAPDRLDTISNQTWRPQEHLRRLLPQNIALTASRRPVSLAQLTNDLAVPLAFVEDEVEQMVEDELLLRTDDGRYQSSLAIFRAGEMEAALNEIEAMVESTGDALLGIMRDSEAAIRAIGFIGSDRDSQSLLWAFLPLSLTSHLRYTAESLGLPTRRPRGHADGTIGWAFGFPANPQLRKWILSSDVAEVFVDGVSVRHYRCVPSALLPERSSLSDADLRTCLALYRSTSGLPRVDRETTAGLVAAGMLRIVGGRHQFDTILLDQDKGQLHAVEAAIRATHVRSPPSLAPMVRLCLDRIADAFTFPADDRIEQSVWVATAVISGSIYKHLTQKGLRRSAQFRRKPHEEPVFAGEFLFTLLTRLHKTIY
jgi:RNA polymerase sigma factor (sigma-70 family)